MKKNHGVRQLTDNPFLNLYEIDAADTKGKHFHYYFASRNDADHIKIRTKTTKPEGIVIYAATTEPEPRLVLLRQYRYPLDDYMYELPAGLIDGDESPALAAIREMKEETGLEFTEYTGGSDRYRRPYYLGPGMTDETDATVYGTVSGAISGALNEDTEDIQVFLADKEMIRQILAKEHVSMRGAYLMMLFLQSEHAFSFLEQ